MQPGGKLSGGKVADQSGQNAEQQSEEYIGGIVHIQIQTGKSDEYRQDYGGDTQTPVIFQDGCADAKDAKVCPEGKEKSEGGGIRSSIAVLTVNGLNLAISGFKIIFPVTSIRTRAIAEATPAFRVLGIIRSTTVSRIQKIPAFPREDMKGMTASRNSLRRRCCMEFRNSISQLIVFPFVQFFSYNNEAY